MTDIQIPNYPLYRPNWYSIPTVYTLYIPYTYLL